MVSGKIRKSKITSWLLNAALVLSLFVFSGFNVAPGITQRSSITELVVTVRASSTRVLPFKSICHKLSLTPWTVVNFQQAVFYHTRTVRILIRQNSEEHIICTIAQLFTLAQRIPFKATEDPFIFCKD